MSPVKDMVIGFMLAFSENPDKILDSIHSPADVDCLITERTEYANSQKVKKENLTQDPVNTVSEFVEGKVDRCYIEPTITGNSNSEEEVQMQNIEGNITVDSHDEIGLWELEQIPHAMVKLTEEQILEEFMLEEEIELKGIDKCKMVERSIDRETVEPPEMSVRIAYEQEECIEEEICDWFLPEIYRAEEKCA